MVDALSRCVFGQSLWRSLLIETIAAHAVRTALQRKQAIVGVRPEFGEYRIVVAGQVELGIAFHGPENLVRMRNQIVQVHGASGKVTSSGRLSSRSPRNT